MTRQTVKTTKPRETYIFPNGDYLTLIEMYQETGRGSRWFWECDGVMTQENGERHAKTYRPAASDLMKAYKAGHIKKAA